MRIFYLHWHEAELKERMAPLKKAGFKVTGHFSTESPPSLKDELPDLAVLSLDRLPSHGRAIAEWLWEAKKRQHIPIIFVGGAPDKVSATRQKFPNAIYCQDRDLINLVTNLQAEQIKNEKRRTRNEE